MCVATGSGYVDVLALDAPTFDALELVAARDRDRWTVERELQASTLEVLSAHAVAYLAAHGVKQSKLPPPIRVPRPGDDPAAASLPPGTVRTTPSGFARLFAGARVEGVS